MHATCLVSRYTVLWIAAASWGAGNKSYATLKNEDINYLVYELGLMFDCGQLYAELRGAMQHRSVIVLVMMGLVLMLCQVMNQGWCALALSLLLVLSLAVIQYIVFPLATTIRTRTVMKYIM